MNSPVSKPSVSELEKTVEALLFVHGEPLSFSRLAAAAEAAEDDVRQAVSSLSARLSQNDSALLIVIDGDSVQLVAASATPALVKLIKEDFNSPLTSSALETIAVIAYLSPVSRVRLDYLRGVNSTFILRSLMLRGLIDRRPDPARPYSFLYFLTRDCLNHFGLSDISKLPEYAKYANLLKSNPEPDVISPPNSSPDAS